MHCMISESFSVCLITSKPLLSLQCKASFRKFLNVDYADVIERVCLKGGNN
jgi:hypothetical protein